MLSQVGNIKPGASVLSEVRDPSGASHPALVAQSFGKGHVAALMIGDLWRWGLRRPDPAESDLDRSWRQTVRWLVGDVPGRVEVAVKPKADAASPAVELRPGPRRRVPAARQRQGRPQGRPARRGRPDPRRRARRPRGRHLLGHLRPQAARRLPGRRHRDRPRRQRRRHREAGWAAQPAADEFARLEPDRDYLKTLAAKTGGEVVDGDRLDSFVTRPRLQGRPDHRALDRAPLAPPALLPRRHRRLGSRVGRSAGSTACLMIE